MTTSATKIVSATDSTNRNNNYNNNNNNNNNTNHNHNISERRNSDASNNSYKISNNNNNNNNNNPNNNNNNNSNKINDKNTSCTGTTTNLTTATTNNTNEYVALKTQTPVAVMEQQHQSITDMCSKQEATLIIPTTTVATMSIPTTNIVQNGIINLTTSSSSLSSTASTTRAMQSDEDFNIRFVNLVRLHKCLYDKKVPEYRNRDNQEKAWSLISQETRESVIHCKERWRNLRACLSRYIKQQSGADPQHKPYYLTEHMAFLLPFLKSTRGGNTMNYSLELHQQLTNNNSSQQSNNLSALFPISATGSVNPMHLSAMTVIPIHNTVNTAASVQIKHSLSENDDEETIDAFDPAITGTLQQQQQQQEEAINLHQYPQHYQHQQHHSHPQLRQRMSPALSDTASANSLQHYIPDVQLSEAPSSEYNQNHNHQNHNHNGHNDSNQHLHHQQQHPHNAKRIKLECDGNNSVNGRICVCGLDNTVANNPDMEFFRSILPDIAFLTAQQKRKLKIGILELIDDVAARYPGHATTVTTTSSNLNMVTSTPVTNHLNGRQRNLIDRSK